MAPLRFGFAPASTAVRLDAGVRNTLAALASVRSMHMYDGEEPTITPGMQQYVDRNNEYLARRSAYIQNTIKKWKFDTIAVHGLYTWRTPSRTTRARSSNPCS
jgi:hypothetical protein